MARPITRSELAGDRPSRISSPRERPTVHVMTGSDDVAPDQYMVLGRTEQGRVVGIDIAATQTILMTGIQGAGKSYSQGVIIESWATRLPGLNLLPRPGIATVFHYSKSQNYKPEWTAMGTANSKSQEIGPLADLYQAGPAAAERVLVLVPPLLLEERRREFPDLEVEPLLFHTSELDATCWSYLMGDSDTTEPAMMVLLALMSRHRHELTPERLSELVAANDTLNEQEKKFLLLKIGLVADYVTDEGRLIDKLRPGTTVVVDLRDEFLHKNTAFRLMLCYLKVYQNLVDERGRPYPRLVCFDEAHQYANDEWLIEEMVTMVRLMRHQSLTILIGSQDPMSIDSRIVDLASTLITLRTETKAWHDHLVASKQQMRHVLIDDLAVLKAGQCFMWSRHCSDPEFNEKPMRVDIRTRATLHGGATKTGITP